MLKSKFILILAMLSVSSLWAQIEKKKEWVLDVDLTADVHPVSPYIFGTNQEQSLFKGLGVFRLGGNRWTGYNWENNASNAGDDYEHSSDNHLCRLNNCGSQSEVPGQAMKNGVEFAASFGAAAIITFPIGDYVAADKNGNVTEKSGPSSKRWVANHAKKTESSKAGVKSNDPAKDDKAVYQSEAVEFIKKTFGSQMKAGTRKIFFMLDNEPALWPSTHPFLHPEKPTYAEVLKRGVDHAKMIKEIIPDAMIMGPVAYGFNEIMSLQDAPDRNKYPGFPIFFEYYLDGMKKAEKENGKRLLDVLDLHWGSEARSTDGHRIITKGIPNSQAVIEARLQAPRSLWDPTYVEKSWITQDYNGKKPIRLIPWIKDMINSKYPGTRISISEYAHGGGDRISGALAQVDTLGIFAREDVFAATHWDRLDSEPYTYGAMKLYVNYDGTGARVGDVSVKAQMSDTQEASGYAFKSSKGNQLYIVLINKTSGMRQVKINVAHGGPYKSSEVYKIVDGSPNPQKAGSISIAGLKLEHSLPAMSATLLVLKK